MSESMKLIVERLKELRGKGTPYDKCSKILKKEGYTNRNGNAYIGGSLNNLMLRAEPSFRTNRGTKRVRFVTEPSIETASIEAPSLEPSPLEAVLSAKPILTVIDSVIIDSLESMVKQALAAQARRSNSTVQQIIPKIVNNMVKEKILAEVENMTLL